MILAIGSTTTKIINSVEYRMLQSISIFSPSCWYRAVLYIGQARTVSLPNDVVSIFQTPFQGCIIHPCTLPPCLDYSTVLLYIHRPWLYSFTMPCCSTGQLGGPRYMCIVGLQKIHQINRRSGWLALKNNCRLRLKDTNQRQRRPAAGQFLHGQHDVGTGTCVKMSGAPEFYLICTKRTWFALAFSRYYRYCRS